MKNLIYVLLLVFALSACQEEEAASCCGSEHEDVGRHLPKTPKKKK